MQEILFLLLPLAFYSGWNAARKRNKRKESQRADGPSTQFVRGINFLLNEEPDKALDIFLEVPVIDGQTAETFLSLGNMFRNRGEVNRALRVHQHLVARPDLDHQQRQSAMLALGEDFFAAGLLDRAESVFCELIAKYPANTEAAEPLRHIYEQLQDWDKAIELSARSARPQNDKDRFIAHYYCEQAEDCLKQSNLYQVDESLKKALLVFPDSARVKVLKAELALSRDQRPEAMAYFRQAIEKDQRLLGTLSTRLLAVFTDEDELSALYYFVRDQYLDSKSNRIFPALLRFAVASGEMDDVNNLIESHLENNPTSVQSLSQSVAVFQQQKGDSEKLLSLLDSALARLAKDDARFQCSQCGYKMHDYSWRCPACQQWDTIQNN